MRKDATEMVDKMKDTIHEQHFEIEELYERIFFLKDKLYKCEDITEEIVQFLIHSHITLGEMEKLGEIL